MIKVLIHASIALLMTMPLSPLAFSKQLVTESQAILSLNHYNLLDPAYTSGSMGLKASIGFEEYRWQNQKMLSRQAYEPQEQVNGHLGFLNLQINKGTPWPVDIGVQVSQAMGVDISKAGIHSQWTIFQGFKLPSFALRAGMNRTFGLKSAELSGNFIGAAIDYSLFSYTTAFASVEQQYHHMDLNRQHRASLELQAKEESIENYSYQSSNLGIIVRVWPGVADLSIAQQTLGNQKRYSFKLSMGI